MLVLIRFLFFSTAAAYLDWVSPLLATVLHAHQALVSFLQVGKDLCYGFSNSVAVELSERYRGTPIRKRYCNR